MKINTFSEFGSITRRILATTLVAASSMIALGSNTATAGAMIPIPNDNLERYLIQQGYDSGELDDQISYANALKVKTLNLSNMDINTIIGLDEFKNLESLDLSGNDEMYYINFFLPMPKLKTLKISGSKIEGITIYDSGIENIDISNCRNLVNLSLYRSNITNLKADGATDLETLQLFGGSLTSLDLSNSSKLQTLVVSQNRLTNVELSHFGNLTYVDVSGNNLSKVDTSKNSSLKNLNIGDNDITTIDLSKNESLETLIASRNMLTSINLTKNTFLDSLNLNTNRLTSIDLSAAVNTRVVLLGGNRISNIEIAGLSKLTVLDVSANRVRKLDARNNSQLAGLKLSNNPIHQLKLPAVMRSLRAIDISDTKIKRLDLRGANLEMDANETETYGVFIPEYFGIGLNSHDTQVTVLVENPAYTKSIAGHSIDDNVKLVRK